MLLYVTLGMDIVFARILILLGLDTLMRNVKALRDSLFSAKKIPYLLNSLFIPYSQDSLFLAKRETKSLNYIKVSVICMKCP